MSTVAPPRRPKPRAPEPDPLEALMKEARRRARRRRFLYAAAGALAVGAAFAAYVGFGGHGTARPAPARGGAPAPQAIQQRVIVARHNGRITVDTAPESLASWYGVSLLDARGDLRPIAHCPHPDPSCGAVWAYAWSPDGARLALWYSHGGHSDDGLHIVDVRSREDRQIYHCVVSCWVTQLAWSPDGALLAGTTNDAAPAEIVLIRTDGVGSTTLHVRAPHPRSWPTWSPSGRLIAFAAGDGRDSAIYVARRDGTHARKLVAGGTAPAWSPLGSPIAYWSACGIRLVTPGGRDVTPPSPFRCHAIRVVGPPVWSPDGRRLAVTGRGPSGSRGIWVMKADGSGLKRVSRAMVASVGGSTPIAWQPVP